MTSLRLKLDAPRAYVDKNFNVTIKTGMSQMLANMLTRIAIHDPARKARIQMDLEKLGEQLAASGAQGAFNVPEFRYIAFGELEVVLAWGVVVKGASPYGRLLGDYYFLALHVSEVEAALEDVFKLSEVLRA